MRLSTRSFQTNHRTTATTIPFGNVGNGSQVIFSNVALDATYGGNVTLTVDGPIYVWVYDVWFGSTSGSTVSYRAVSASFGWNGFDTIELPPTRRHHCLRASQAV